MTTDPTEVRRRAGLFAAISLAVAGGTAWVGYSLVSRHEARVVAESVGTETTMVVVATRSLPAGTPIGAEDVRLEARAQRSISMDATFEQLGDVVGQTPRQAVLEGEPVRAERLQLGPGGLEARAAIQEGARAVSVLVDAAAGVAGLLEPGFCVDVLVTVRPEEEAIRANWVTETILQDVRVIAVEGASLGPPESGSGRANPRRELVTTLEVGPEEAERLAMASALGQIHLSLRHAEDHVLHEHRGPLVTNAMVGLAVTTEAAKRQRRRLSGRHRKGTDAEVIQGEKVEVERFGSDGKKVRSGSRRGR